MSSLDLDSGACRKEEDVSVRSWWMRYSLFCRLQSKERESQRINVKIERSPQMHPCIRRERREVVISLEGFFYLKHMNIFSLTSLNYYIQ